jgi:predicted acetyltransferase
MSDVEVIVASAGQKGALDNLFQLYVHDFSEHWAGTDDGDLGDDGRFEPYRHLDSYWDDESRVPLLIRADKRLAGFALLNQHSQTGQGVDRNMAEFFIARKHRRSGVGTAAVHAILVRYPGVWEIAVARRNVAAAAFWRRAVEHHPLVADLEEIDLTAPSWNGPVLRFRVGEAAPA